MDYFFASRDKVRGFGAIADGIDLDFLRYVTRQRALKDGTPFFLGSDMRPLEPHCSFFLDLAKTLKAKSLQDYTYDFLDFLESLGLAGRRTTCRLCQSVVLACTAMIRQPCVSPYSQVRV
ncbi:hypothetical protein IMZ11_08790 [Microtetraspora sp. AC03309]|uniref:hypothetical protein n=1 Tax=Microtetraspora sp. AC03309 TaxID=2779376 RepID=UPI001E43F65E|nr:hypothetical protein [Microtetraspora sp. AC03309]MCC5575734.1 hypothetical protein [Microtetraspora sp. AC03309]